MIDAAISPNAATPGLINPSRAVYTYGYMSNVPLLAGAIDRAITSETHDYRSLAVKVDLYDELREIRMVQSTGVNWAWADTSYRRKLVVPLSRLGYWHYDAIVLSSDVLECALRKDGVLKVGAGGLE